MYGTRQYGKLSDASLRARFLKEPFEDLSLKMFSSNLTSTTPSNTNNTNNTNQVSVDGLGSADAVVATPALVTAHDVLEHPKKVINAKIWEYGWMDVSYSLTKKSMLRV